MILEFAIEEDFLWAPPVLLAVDEGAAEPAAVVFSVWFADVLATEKEYRLDFKLAKFERILTLG